MQGHKMKNIILTLFILSLFSCEHIRENNERQEKMYNFKKKAKYMVWHGGSGVKIGIRTISYTIDSMGYVSFRDYENKLHILKNDWSIEEL
jgi:hypothetical protein